MTPVLAEGRVLQSPEFGDLGKPGHENVPGISKIAEVWS
jgi:hypothetical protein